MEKRPCIRRMGANRECLRWPTNGSNRLESNSLRKIVAGKAFAYFDRRSNDFLEYLNHLASCHSDSFHSTDSMAFHLRLFA